MKLLAHNLFTQKADFCRLRTFDFLIHGIKKGASHARKWIHPTNCFTA